MIDRSPLRLERSSASLTHRVNAKRRPEGSRHGEGQAFAPEFRQRGVPRERTWECARTHQGRATGRGGNYGGPGPCRAFALLQERARAPPPPTLAHGTTSERPDRRPDHDCFALAERKSAEPMPRRLVLVRSERLLDCCLGARSGRKAVASGVGDASAMAAEESTTPDLVELSRRSVGRINRGDVAARGLRLGEVRGER